MHHCFTSRRARAYTVCRCGPLDPRPNVYVHPGLSCPACTSVSHVRSLALGDASTSTAEKVVVARISAGPPPSGRPGCEGGRIPFYLQERVRLFPFVCRSTTGFRHFSLGPGLWGACHLAVAPRSCALPAPNEPVVPPRLTLVQYTLSIVLSTITYPDGDLGEEGRGQGGNVVPPSNERPRDCLPAGRARSPPCPHVLRSQQNSVRCGLQVPGRPRRGGPAVKAEGFRSTSRSRSD